MKAVGFWWWSDMQTVPPKMPLEIYTTNVYTLGFWIFFFSNLLSYSFQKAITDILHWWIGYKEFTMHHVTAMCPICTLSIDVFYIFVDASLWGYSEICINAMYMKHWQGWGEYLTGRREISLIILVHITHPCLTTESKQSIFSI